MPSVCSVYTRKNYRATHEKHRCGSEISECRASFLCECKAGFMSGLSGRDVALHNEQPAKLKCRQSKSDPEFFARISILTRENQNSNKNMSCKTTLNRFITLFPSPVRYSGIFVTPRP